MQKLVRPHLFPDSDASYTLTFSHSGIATTVSWTVSEGNYFRLSRSIAMNSGYSEVYAGANTSVSDSGLLGATLYYYRLQICGSANSNSCLSLDAAASFNTTTAPNISDYSEYLLRNSAQDFDTLVAAGNTSVKGIWSNGSTMWVLDDVTRRIYAYNFSSKAYVSGDTISLAGVDTSTGK